MPILTQINNTKFRSMKYGADRLNGGSSNQPYIQTPIFNKSPGTGGPDFLIRGGTLLPGRVANDVSRLTQMFVDTKSLNGILFVAKQEMLGLSEVNVNAEKDNINSLLSINNKIYNPASTIAQAALTPEGIHISKQGIVPVNMAQSLFGLILGKDKGRLVNLYNKHIKNIHIGNILYSYSGGPGSIGGVGQTNIKLASDRTVSKIPFSNIINSPNLSFSGILKSFVVSVSDHRKIHIAETNKDPEVFAFRQNDKRYRTGVSNIYNNITKNQFINEIDTSFIFGTGKAKSSTEIGKGDILKLSEPSSLSYDEIKKFTKNPSHKIGADFRNKISKKSPLWSKSLDYESERNYETRTNFDTNIESTSLYSTSTFIYDKVNAKEIYRSSKADPVDTNDLVKFRIAIIDNDTPSQANYIHFRAYIDSFSDSYGSKWNPTTYVGRGEEFYRYGGFTRDISLSWTIVAQSKSELAPMYRKLNYLASSLAPNYSKNGYMRGNLVKLTIGGYLFEQPGIISSLTYDVPSESTWEIGINAGESSDRNDPKVKELPHIIKVTNVKFTPIHKFVPQLFNRKAQNERFIALTTNIEKSPTDLYYGMEIKDI